MEKKQRKLWQSLELLLPLAVLLLGVLSMYLVTPAVVQAEMPKPMPQTFVGEYSRDGENWQTLEGTETLSALEGDLYLRGHFAQPVSAGARLCFYNNHIGCAFYVNGELGYMDGLMGLAEYGMEIYPVMCDRGWEYWWLEDALPEEAQIQIHLFNPHRFGNESAYRDFLQTLCCTPNEPSVLAKELSSYSSPYLICGALLMIAAMMLLGSAVAGVILRAPIGAMLGKLGLLAAFAGGYFIFDVLNLNLWSEDTLLNTYGWQISFMYMAYLFGILAKDMLTGKRNQVAKVTLWVSAACNSGIVLLSFVGKVLLYDTLPFWAIHQSLVCVIFAVLLTWELCRTNKEKKFITAFFLLLSVCGVLDIFGIFRRIYSTGNLTKLMTGIFFLYAFLYAAVFVARNAKASARAQKLEKELEESRIAVMVSQIQPHFIFNVLGTLRGLCREDPEQVWRGLGDFSTYLRGNMNALTNAKFIRFDNELRHVETYLRLEKMRLGDKLSVVYDIQEKNFYLPPLTVQPLVENAVKHGIFYKASGGTVTVSAGKGEQTLWITVEDDGVGFDMEHPEPDFENHTRIGLTNVRKRVEEMMGGSLRVESRKHQGTKVTVEIPITEKALKGE